MSDEQAQPQPEQPAEPESQPEPKPESPFKRFEEALERGFHRG